MRQRKEVIGQKFHHFQAVFPQGETFEEVKENKLGRPLVVPVRKEKRC